MVIKKVYIGNRPLVEWIHVKPLDSSSLKFKKNSVDEIFIDRVIEDINQNEIINRIQEWKRVLKVGGRFTIIFSDVVRAVFLYKRGLISNEKLHSIISSQKSYPSLEWIEGILIMRFPNVYEEHLNINLREKKIWETMLVAEKKKI